MVGGAERAGCGSGEDVTGSHRDVLGLSQLQKRFISELLSAGRSQLTANGYDGVVTRFIKWAGGRGIPVFEATREDILQWLEEERLTGKKPSSRRTTFTIVREFYRWMVGRGVVMRDPFIGIKPIKVPDTLHSVADVPEVVVMLEKCERALERAIIHTIYSTGARRAGMLGMKLQDLDLERGRVKIRLKGGGEMYGNLQAGAIAALREWLVARAETKWVKLHPEEDALWIGSRGPMARNQLALLIAAVASRAGLKHLTPHSFRRGFAKALTEADVDIQKTQRLMGHKHIAATEKYTKYATLKLKDAWRNLPEL